MISFRRQRDKIENDDEAGVCRRELESAVKLKKGLDLWTTPIQQADANL